MKNINYYLTYLYTWYICVIWRPLFLFWRTIRYWPVFGWYIGQLHYILTGIWHLTIDTVFDHYYLLAVPVMRIDNAILTIPYLLLMAICWLFFWCLRYSVTGQPIYYFILYISMILYSDMTQYSCWWRYSVLTTYWLFVTVVPHGNLWPVVFLTRWPWYIHSDLLLTHCCPIAILKYWLTIIVFAIFCAVNVRWLTDILISREMTIQYGYCGDIHYYSTDVFCNRNAMMTCYWPVVAVKAIHSVLPSWPSQYLM